MRKVLTAILLFLTTLFPEVQSQLSISTEKTLGGSNNDYLYSAIELEDFDILCGGTTYSSISGEITANNKGGTDYWCIRVDSSSNNTIWNYSYGGSGDEEFQKTIKLSEDKFLIAGSSTSGSGVDKSENSRGGYDYWMIKINGNGLIEWDKTIGGNNDDVLQDVIQTSDGGFLLGGYSTSDLSGEKSGANIGGKDFWIVKTDNAGDIEWDKTIGGLSDDILTTVVEANDYYLLAGYSNSSQGGDKITLNYGGFDYWAVLIDNNQNFIWERSYGGTEDDQLYDAVKNTEAAEGFLLGGSSSSDSSGTKTDSSFGGNDFWLLNIDINGAILWDTIYGGKNNDELKDILISIDGQYIIAGYSASGSSGNKTSTNRGENDYWMIKVDTNAQKNWDYSFGTTKDELLYHIASSCTRGYLLGGSSNGDDEDKTEPSRGGYDYWPARIDVPTQPKFIYTEVCDGSATQFYDKSETKAEFWYWSFDDPTSGAENSSYAQNPTHVYDDPGTYMVSLTVKEGCQSDTGVTLPVVVLENYLTDIVAIGQDTTVCEGETVVLRAGDYDSDFSYIWNTGDDTWVVTVDQPGEYYVVVSDGTCTSGDNIIIGNCPRIYMPNIFTPDGDGVNDYFFVYGDGIEEIDILVFDRWGNLVFSSDEITLGWDGKINGSDIDAAIDTYVYKITYKGIGNAVHKKKGHISLVR